MSQMRQRSVAGIKPGEVFEVRRTFTREDTLAFGQATQDYNPVHYDAQYARTWGMDGMICHGLLTGGMICQVGGQIGCLATGMDFRFRRAVYAGDTITCRLTITQLQSDGRAQAEAVMTNQRGEVVVEAQLSGILPTGAVRDDLARLVDEGDVTNPLAERPGS